MAASLEPALSGISFFTYCSDTLRETLKTSISKEKKDI